MAYSSSEYLTFSNEPYTTTTDNSSTGSDFKLDMSAVALPNQNVFIVSMIVRHVQVVFNLIGNSLVLIAFKRFPDLRNPTWWLITGMC